MASQRFAVVAVGLTVASLLLLAIAGYDNSTGGSAVGLLIGHGFLGDLPGGENGHQSVNEMKSLVHSAADAKKMQEGLAQRLAGGKDLQGREAKAVAAAAAEIAKILSAPSARDIVLGHHSSDDSDSKQAIATWDGNSASTNSDRKEKRNPTPWLKTPSEENQFTYSHKRLARTFSMCSTRHDYSCNDMDVASQAHGWSDTPDRSVMGAANYRSEE